MTLAAFRKSLPRVASAAMASLFPLAGCTSKPVIKSSSSDEGSSSQPARPPFAAVYTGAGGYSVVALVLDRVNPKETPRYQAHPSIRALDQAFARHMPGRVSVETDGSPEVLTRRVVTCEERSFQGPCPETTYAASLARRRSAAIEVRAPGSSFARYLPPAGSGGQTGVVMAVFAPDAFAREKEALGARLGAPRYFVPLEYR